MAKLSGWDIRAKALKKWTYERKVSFNEKVENYDCADCGQQAEEWDHRNYLRYMDVESVCHKCNCKRGTAYPPANNEMFECLWWHGDKHSIRPGYTMSFRPPHHIYFKLDDIAKHHGISWKDALYYLVVKEFKSLNLRDY